MDICLKTPKNCVCVSDLLVCCVLFGFVTMNINVQDDAFYLLTPIKIDGHIRRNWINEVVSTNPLKKMNKFQQLEIPKMKQFREFVTQTLCSLNELPVKWNTLLYSGLFH